ARTARVRSGVDDALRAPVRPAAVTFSIVAAEPGAGEARVGVASKFLAAAAVVSWARGGIGAVATQVRAQMLPREFRDGPQERVLDDESIRGRVLAEAVQAPDDRDDIGPRVIAG